MPCPGPPTLKAGGPDEGGGDGGSRHTPLLSDPNAALHCAASVDAGMPKAANTGAPTSAPTINALITMGSTLRGQPVAVTTCLLQQAAAIRLHCDQITE